MEWDPGRAHAVPDVAGSRGLGLRFAGAGLMPSLLFIVPAELIAHAVLAEPCAGAVFKGCLSSSRPRCPSRGGSRRRPRSLGTVHEVQAVSARPKITVVGLDIVAVGNALAEPSETRGGLHGGCPPFPPHTRLHAALGRSLVQSVVPPARTAAVGAVWGNTGLVDPGAGLGSTMGTATAVVAPITMLGSDAQQRRGSRCLGCRRAYPSARGVGPGVVAVRIAVAEISERCRSRILRAR
jgi:hypothetical protein